MMNEQYEIFDDPFKMLILLASLVAEQKSIKLDYENVPSYENETFQLEHDKFVYKKDNTEITWFQFLGRDIHCSKDLSRQAYNQMFVACMASLYNFT
jgi:hypothetical protein